MQEEQGKPLDWDESEKKRPSGLLVLCRVIAALFGIALIIGALLFAFFIVLCVQTGSTSIFGLPIRGAFQALLHLLPASVLGLLLVEFGATGKTSSARYWIGGISLLSLVLVVFYGLPYGLR